jgi:sugar-specific transcriptional regulator TrmB
MQNVETTLEKIGLSPNEIKVYLVLNDHGSIKAGKISKLAKIDRSSAYNALKLLQEKGFVSYVHIGKIKWFQAAGPKRILEYLEEQTDDVKNILPELEERHKRKKIQGQVRLFKGIKGVKSIFLDIARTGKDNYVFGSEGQFTERMPEFALQFKRMKKEKKIKTHLICRKDRTDIDVSKGMHRYLPKIAESPAVTNIYGDKIAILIWTDEPEGVVIENASAAKAYKSYFDAMWKVARPFTKSS